MTFITVQVNFGSLGRASSQYPRLSGSNFVSNFAQRSTKLLNTSPESPPLDLCNAIAYCLNKSTPVTHAVSLKKKKWIWQNMFSPIQPATAEI